MVCSFMDTLRSVLGVGALAVGGYFAFREFESYSLFTKDFTNFTAVSAEISRPFAAGFVIS
jgi:hypothetical protein